MITSDMREKLRAPLPPESLSQHPTKAYLTTIKAIYVVERLNDVFGSGAWTTKTEWITTEGKMVCVKSVLEIPEHNIRIEQFGGNDNSDTGDAFKGATTDALTKMASYLEIGIDVFKGLSGSGDGNTKPPPKPASQPQSVDTGEYICPIHNIPFKKNTNKDGESWWSHKKPEGGWCNESAVMKQLEATKGDNPNSLLACDICGKYATLKQSGGKMVCGECDAFDESGTPIDWDTLQRSE